MTVLVTSTKSLCILIEKYIILEDDAACNLI